MNPKNLLLSAPHSINPDSLVNVDKVFRREYPDHTMRIGTRDGVFFVNCEIDQKLSMLLQQSYDTQTINEHCRVIPKVAKKEIQKEETTAEFDDDYHLAPELIVAPSDRHPQHWTIEQLKTWLSRHTHVWYTGAGLSIAAGLPSMSDLKSGLGVDLSVDIDPLLHTRLTHPQQVELTRMDFANKMRHSKPTPAHRALQELTGRYHMNIITENTDNLQQQTGIEPLMIGDPHLFKQTITTEHMRQIDALITIGLGSGDRGLLGYYKQSHPTGIIIAINTSCPPYLSTHDIWIPGDCQEILPTLSKD